MGFSPRLLSPPDELEKPRPSISDLLSPSRPDDPDSEEPLEAATWKAAHFCEDEPVGGCASKSHSRPAPQSLTRAQSLGLLAGEGSMDHRCSADHLEEGSAPADLQLLHFGSFLKGYASTDPEQELTAMVFRATVSSPSLSQSEFQAQASLGDPSDQPTSWESFAGANSSVGRDRRAFFGKSLEWETIGNPRPRSEQEAFMGMLQEAQALGARTPKSLPKKASLQDLVSRDAGPAVASAWSGSVQKSRSQLREEQRGLQLRQKQVARQDMEAKRQRKMQERACESLRALVQGRIFATGLADAFGAADCSGGAARCTGAQEFAMVDLWLRLDEELTGEVEAQKFVSSFAHGENGDGMDIDLLHARRVARCLSQNSGTGRFSWEALARLLWPKLREQDHLVLEEVFWLRRLERLRVPTPPLLPPSDCMELLRNFGHCDRGRAGVISYKDLIKGGLVNREQMRILRDRHDTAGDGRINHKDFVEMFCADGFRAHEDSKTAVRTDGQVVSFVRATSVREPWLRFVGWVPHCQVQSLLSEKPAGISVVVPERRESSSPSRRALDIWDPDSWDLPV